MHIHMTMLFSSFQFLSNGDIANFDGFWSAGEPNTNVENTEDYVVMDVSSGMFTDISATPGLNVVCEDTPMDLDQWIDVGMFANNNYCIHDSIIEFEFNIDGVRLLFPSSDFNFDSANNYCTEKGGIIFEPRNVFTRDAAFAKAYTFGWSFGWWIGVTDENEEGM